jgi:hypothetical protein
MVPGLAWWNLWPLIVVLAGVIQMFTPGRQGDWRPGRVLDGLGAVIVGCVLLGNTLGILAWGLWWTFATMWPVLIIALGISILGRGLRQSWLRSVSPLLIWAALGYAVATSLTGVGGIGATPQLVLPGSAGQPFSFSEPLGATQKAKLEFKGGAGEIVVKGGSELVSTRGTSPFGEPTVSVDRSSPVPVVSLSMADARRPGFSLGAGAGTLEVLLSEATLWDVSLETGASNLKADLSAVPVSALALKTGASSTMLKLGPVPSTVSRTEVIVKAGVSSIEILVPRAAEVRLDTRDGLSGTDIDERLKPIGAGVWRTPGHASAAKTIDIAVEAGVSSISVRTY